MGRGMLLRQRALRRRGRADAQSAMPLPRMPIYLRRRAEPVHADAARWLSLQQRHAQTICAERSGSPGDAGILRRMRHASCHAAAGPAGGDLENRHARRSKPVRRPADGDLHRRPAAVPSDSRRACRASSGCRNGHRATPFVIASEAKQSSATSASGLLRRFAPRNDEEGIISSAASASPYPSPPRHPCATASLH